MAKYLKDVRFALIFRREDQEEAVVPEVEADAVQAELPAAAENEVMAAVADVVVREVMEVAIVPNVVEIAKVVKVVNGLPEVITIVKLLPVAEVVDHVVEKATAEKRDIAKINLVFLIMIYGLRFKNCRP